MPYTDKERKHVSYGILTLDVTWDPAILENIISEDKTYFDSISDHVEDTSPLFDIYGDYNKHHEIHNGVFHRYGFGNRDIPVPVIPYIVNTSYSAHFNFIRPRILRNDKQLDYTSHIPLFA